MRGRHLSGDGRLDEGGRRLSGDGRADKDGEANMCCRKWTGDDDYSMPLDLRDTYQQRRVIWKSGNLLACSHYW